MTQGRGLENASGIEEGALGLTWLETVVKK